MTRVKSNDPQSLSGNSVTESLVLKYDGSGAEIRDHSVDAEILAGSLSGLASLIKEVNFALDGSEGDIQVKVNAFQPGSFEYLFDVIQNPQDHLLALSVIGFSSTATTASLVSAFRWLNGRTIDKIIMKENGNCEVYVGDDIKEFPFYMRKLLTSRAIRNALSKLIHTPLSGDGVNSFSIMSQSGRTEIVKFSGSEEAAFFKPKSNVIKDKFSKRTLPSQVVSFLTVHIGSRSKAWSVENEGESIQVAMRDEEFVYKIKNGDEPLLLSSQYVVDIVEWENLYTMDKKYILAKVHGPIDQVD